MKTVLRMKFHMPVFSNPHVDMFQYDRGYKFHEGEIYYFTNGCTHSVENRGDSARVHLIWDMLLTDDTFGRIFSEGDDLGPELKRVKGGHRQVDIFGAWSWNDFEQEPEKTWTQMLTQMKDLIDVSPPPVSPPTSFAIPRPPVIGSRISNLIDACPMDRNVNIHSSFRRLLY